MENLFTTIGQWFPFALIIGVLFLMIIMMLRGAKTTCCNVGDDWYNRPPIDFQALRGLEVRIPADIKRKRKNSGE